MFDFFKDVSNYEDRKVDNFDKDGLIIDTARVSDGRKPFETGINWPSEYPNSDGWIIVEAYDTKELAQAGHNRWVLVMTNYPPNELVDCLNAEIAELASEDRLIAKRKV